MKQPPVARIELFAQSGIHSRISPERNPGYGLSGYRPARRRMARRRCGVTGSCVTAPGMPIASSMAARSVRSPDFGGHYSKTRREVDDGRNSIAMPVRSDGHVLGCINLTWRRKALTLTQVVDSYASDLCMAATAIEDRMAASATGTAGGRP